MSTSLNYTLRAVTAFALMIGFYLFAMAVVAGLFALVYLDVRSGTIHVKLVLGGTIGALAILWAIVPRPDRFLPPGPRLDRSRQPRLFEEIESVAAATNQVMPREVYLVGDVNAWVSQRGGLMGFGGRRVMGLGLPLLQGLTRAQMRAVIAHEFGHFYSGDTRLGPVLYRTRSAIGRAIQGLGHSWLQFPFRWYGSMFLQITHGTSRRQEFAADALAARRCGSRPLIDGLKALPGLSGAFAAYWQSEVVPLMGAGWRPPIAEGFRLFLDHPRVAAGVERVTRVALGESAGNPYDTHPPLPDRIAALDRLPAGDGTDGNERAVTLLQDVGELERELLSHLFGHEQVSRLRPLDWNETGTRAILPSYEALVRSQQVAVAGLTPARLAEITGDLAAFGERLVLPPGQTLPREQREQLAVHVLGAAFSLALHRDGWAIDAGPGHPVRMSKGGEVVLPFHVVEALRSGDLQSPRWRARTAALGIDELVLGQVVSVP